jgi:hypothetical protein
MSTPIPEDELFERLAESAPQPADPARAPAKLKARIYSALMLLESAAGPLASFTETAAAGRELCVFEDLVRIAPVGEGVKSLNICRICHARVLAEHLEHPPIWWPHCPYVKFHQP